MRWSGWIMLIVFVAAGGAWIGHTISARQAAEQQHAVAMARFETENGKLQEALTKARADLEGLEPAVVQLRQDVREYEALQAQIGGAEVDTAVTPTDRVEEVQYDLEGKQQELELLRKQFAAVKAQTEQMVELANSVKGRN